MIWDEPAVEAAGPSQIVDVFERITGDMKADIAFLIG
jgi:hypothetical protein